MTPEVIKGGEIVNSKRKAENLPELRLIVATLVQNEGKNEKLSSTHLREMKASKCSEETYNYLKKVWSLVGITMNWSSEHLDIW